MSEQLLKKLKINLKSREDRIRTCDPLVPNQVRYRPALLPDPMLSGLPGQRNGLQM